jgi:tripartite-type tricarboxylate transporter receptor subunit TctC
MAKSKGHSAMLRRSLLTAAALGLAAPAFAQARPLHMIIPVGVGGVTVVVGRILADALQTQLGRPVVPENIAGAGSTVGAAAFHRLPADGNTIFIGTNKHPVIRAIYPNFPHDPVTDFIPLALIGR